MDDTLTQEYEIKAPIADIIQMFENDFLDDIDLAGVEGRKRIELSKEEVAKFFAFSLISFEDNGSGIASNINDLFSVHDKEHLQGEKYTALQVFDTVYVVVFSELKKQILLDVLSFITIFFPSAITENRINYVALSVNVVRILCRCVKKLDTPLKMCIFKTLVESHKESFRAEDIYNLPCFSVRNDNGIKDYPLCDRLNLECDKRTTQGKCGVSFKTIDDKEPHKVNVACLSKL